MSEYSLPIYRYLPIDHFETPRHVHGLIRDSEQSLVIKSHKLIIQIIIVTLWRTCHGLKSVEDQVSADVGRVVQASKPDLMARDIAIDLLQMAKGVGP